MQPIRLLVVDDEPHARAGIRKLLEKHPDFVVAGEAADGPAAVRGIRDLRPDAVLLDVQIPELDAFEVLDEVLPGLLPEHVPLVVFITAYDRFAVDAFEVSALDYLVKPYSDARFAAALDRVRRTLRSAELGELGRRLVSLVAEVSAPRSPAAAPAGGAGEDAPSHFVVKTADGEVVLAADEVEWIEAASYYARLHVGGRSYLLRESLNSLESRLDPGRFARVHRSAIVGLRQVREVREDGDGQYVVVLRGGARVRLSRTRHAAFSALLRRALSRPATPPGARR